MDVTRPEFAAVWRRASGIEGWLTEAQARVLFEHARALPPGSIVVEIGSHRGRSAVVLANALGDGSRLVAIDPFDPAWRYGGSQTRSILEANLAEAGVADRVDIRAETSRAARAAYAGRVDLLYIDGKHDYWTVCDDLTWAARLPTGGTVLVHDAFSSLGVTLGLLRTLLFSSGLTYLGRTGSLARLGRSRPRLGARARLLTELPWWIRNLVVKVLLRLRLHPLARLLGHRGAADPF